MRFRSLLYFLCCLSFCVVLSAQKYIPKKFTFSGFADANQAELLAASGLKEGSAVGQEEINAAALQLSKTGLFSDVRFTFDGTELHFALKPAEGLVPVFYENFPWWDAKALTALVSAKVSLFHGAVVPESGLQAQVVAALTALVAEKGVQATVTPAPKTDLKTGQSQGVQFHIETPSVEIGEVQFSGIAPEWAEQVGAIQKAAKGQPYNDVIEATLEAALRNIYHRQGYLDVALTGFLHGAPLAAGDKVAVPVSAAIDAGAQYRLASLKLSGDVLMTPDEFAKRAKIHAGDVANEDLLRQTLSSVASPYKAKGYLRATIKANPIFNRAQHTVDYEITVAPGDVYHMGKLNVTNLDEEKKALVLKYWTLLQGDVYDATYPPSFLNKNAKALHALDGWSASYKQFEHEDTHVVDLAVVFQPGGLLH